MSQPSLPYVNMWRGDESLYSWCAIFHRETGSFSAKRTAETLFGVVHAPRLVDIPTGLAHFCQQTHGHLGAERQILHERTVFPYLSRFLTAERRNRAAEGASTPSKAASTKSKLGLKLAHFGHTTSLKACPDCMTEQVLTHGTPIWRLRHQLPMTFICVEHGTPLLIFSARRSLWLLPDDCSADSRPDLKDPATKTAALNMATVDNELLGPGFECEVGHVRRCTIEALARIQILKPHLRLDVGVLANFLNQSAAWRVATCHLPVRPTDDIGALVEGLLKQRVQCHSFVWTLIWSAIIEVEPAAKSWLKQALMGSGLEWKQLNLDLIEGQQLPEVPTNLLEVLLRNATLENAARELRVSTATLKRWLQRHGEIRATWLRHHSDTRCARAVNGILEYISSHPAVNRAEVLRQCKVDVAWLQRNLPEQLRQLLEAIPSSRTAQRSLWPLAVAA